MKRHLGVWETILLCYWNLSFIEVYVNAGSCINRIPLLTGLYNLVQNDNRINASTSLQNYSPWNVRMSSNGWCSALTCVAATTAMEQYLLVNFGAEVVVEAIGTAAASNGNYVESYMVEYARSDGQYFAVSPKSDMKFDGNGACTQAEQVQQFNFPIIAQYIRIVPVEWVGSMICFKMELYGCYVRECPEVSNLSDNETLLPDANVYESTTFSFIPGTEDDVREAWCAQTTDNTPSVVLTFTQPLYITYATTTGVSMYWLREYSYITVDTSGRSVYSDVDGTTVYGQTDNGQYTVLFWDPINTSAVELRIDDYVPVFACVGIKLYGCVFSEVIDHSSLSTSIDPTTPVSVTSDQCDGSISTISAVATVTVTTTSTIISATTLVTTSATTVTTTSATTVTTTSATTVTTASTTTVTTASTTTVTTASTTTVTTASTTTVTTTSTTTVTTASATTVTITVTSSPTPATKSCITRLNSPITGTVNNIKTSAPTVTITVTSSSTFATMGTATSSSTTRSVASSPIKGTLTSSTAYATTVAVAAVNSPITITVTNPAACTATQNKDRNASAIYAPVIVAIGLILCVIIFAVVWKLRHKKMFKFEVINSQPVNSEMQPHQSVNSHGKKSKRFTQAILSFWKRDKRNADVQNTPIYESLLMHESCSSISTDSSYRARLNNDSRHEYVSPEYAVVDDKQVRVNNADDRNNHLLAESYLVPISRKNEPPIVYNPAYDESCSSTIR